MDSETTAIIVAVVALLATIVGAAISAAASYFIAVRQERAARETDKLRNAIETKRAARLVYAELTTGVAAVSMALEQKEWWPDLMKVSSEEWKKYGGYKALNFLQHQK
jgi:HAMP domain-containing protein